MATGTTRAPISGRPRPLDTSAALFERARLVLPDGVTSTSRGMARPFPLRFVDGQGSRLTDVDGNEYIDYELAHATQLLGHRPPRVVRWVEEALRRGPLCAGEATSEVELAERVAARLPSVEMVSFGNSGSEAIHAAVGLARGVTGRRLILKFEGHYHGWVDPMPVNTYVNPPYDGVTAAGVPGWPASPDVLVARWNDLDDVDRILAAHGPDIALVAMEPIAIDCGILPIDREFLVALRERCTRNGSLMMFDEMVSGFRVAPGGAQELLDVMPDITIFGKAVACGFPLAGIGSSRELFGRARAVDVRFMGTFNGHALSLAAGLGALETYELEGAQIYPDLEANGRLLADGLRAAATATGAPVVVHQLGPIVTLFWGVEPPVVTYADTARTNRAAIALLDEHLMVRGVRTLRASRWYVSAAHTPDDIAETVAIAQEAFAACLSDLDGPTG